MPATPPLRAGLVGCGNVARRHLAGYRANGIPVTAVTDANPRVAEALAADAGFPYPRVFSDTAGLLASGLADMVSVCTPPAAHEAAVLAALGAGVHVLLEKPQAHTRESAAAIARAAREAAGAARPAWLMLAFRHRFIEANRRLKQLVDAGEIGEPVFFENIFCGPAFGMRDTWFSRKAVAGGGCLLDTGSHSVDLFRHFFGEVAAATGQASRRLEGTDVEDTGVISLRSAGGVLGVLVSSWVAGAGVATLRVMGESGQLLYDYARPDRIAFLRLGAAAEESVAVRPDDGFAAQIGHFAAAIREGRPPAVTAEDGLAAFEIIDGLARAEIL